MNGYWLSEWYLSKQTLLLYINTVSEQDYMWYSRTRTKIHIHTHTHTHAHTHTHTHTRTHAHTIACHSISAFRSSVRLTALPLELWRLQPWMSGLSSEIYYLYGYRYSCIYDHLQIFHANIPPSTGQVYHANILPITRQEDNIALPAKTDKWFSCSFNFSSFLIVCCCLSVVL